MLPRPLQQSLDEITNDLDRVVYRLEQPTPADVDQERKALRRELEALRDRLEMLARQGL